MEIRPATADDLDALVPLQREVQGLHVEAHPEIYRESTDDDLRAGMRHFLEQDQATIWVAWDGEAPLGFVVVLLKNLEGPYRLPTRVLHVNQMGVSQHARRQGVGRALMAEVRAVARREGCQSLSLDVLEFNEEAKAFYASEGFEPFRLRMVCPLSSQG